MSLTNLIHRIICTLPRVRGVAAVALPSGWILIDTPSVSTCADAFTLSTLARRVLMVARRQRTSMHAACDLLGRLERGGVDVIGSVLCDA